MDESKQYFRATIHAREAVEQLKREGCSAEKATSVVAAVKNAEEFAVTRGLHSSDEGRFIERLRQLPN